MTGQRHNFHPSATRGLGEFTSQTYGNTDKLFTTAWKTNKQRHHRKSCLPRVSAWKLYHPSDAFY